MAGGVRFTFEVFGDVQIDRTLAAIEHNVDDATEVWEKLADDFGSGNRDQFASQGASSGGWQALSPAYAAWKQANYPGKKILRRTDELYQSLTSRPFGVEQISPGAMAIGSDVEHGKYHQLGDGVPRRRPVELTEVRRRNWVRLIQRYIMTGKA